MGESIPNEITDYNEIKQRLGYKDWFSNKIARSYMNSFLRRLPAIKNRTETGEVLAELTNAMTVYSLIVYYIYPDSPELRKAIASSKEYGENFRLVSDWLSKNGGQELGKAFLEGVSFMEGQG